MSTMEFSHVLDTTQRKIQVPHCIPDQPGEPRICLPLNTFVSAVPYFLFLPFLILTAVMSHIPFEAPFSPEWRGPTLEGDQGTTQPRTNYYKLCISGPSMWRLIYDSNTKDLSNGPETFNGNEISSFWTHNVCDH